MNTLVIEENEGDRQLKRALTKRYVIPFFRVSIAGLLLTLLTAKLIAHLGSQFPPIAWLTPVLPLLFFLQLAVGTFMPNKWEITPDFIRQSGASTITVKWRDVKTWRYEIVGESLRFIFHLRWQTRKTITFHSSHGEQYLVDLVDRCIKPFQQRR